MTKVLIIILNWNGVADTIDCLNAINKQLFPFTVVVVDNGSTDNSVPMLEKRQGIILLHQPSNLGFAGGVNVGIKYALDHSFDAVVLLNNDARVDKHWLKELVKTSDLSSKTGIVTSLLLDEGGDKIDTTGEQYSTWGLAFPRSRDQNTSKAPKSGYVFGATGGASLYKTELFKDIGLFDEDFFAYYEDVDISFRAQLAGWKVAYTNKAIAYHKRGATSKKIPGFTTYQTFKNLPMLYTKNVPKGLRFHIGIRLLLAYSLMWANAVKNGSGVPASKGVFMGLILCFKKLKDRRKIQKGKKVPTEYVKSILYPDLPPYQTGLRKFRKFFTGK